MSLQNNSSETTFKEFIFRYLTVDDFSKYTSLIRNFSTVHHQEHLLKNLFEDFVFQQNEYEFVLLLCDDQNNICISAKLNYNYKFSKHGAHDIFIQDFSFNQHLSYPMDELICTFFEFLENFEKEKDFIIHRKFIISNYHITQFDSIFRDFEYSVVS